jgi:uncharacterized membrane protein
VDLRRRRGLISIVLALPLLVAATVPAVAAQGLSLTTPFTGVKVSPGGTVTFDLKVKTTSPARINLEVSGVPSGWTASLHGGGFVVSSIETNGTDATEVRLDVDVPADATGTRRITVAASDASSREELPLDITVEAAAGGEVTMDTDIPARRGPASSTFSFSLTVHNGTESDLTYTAVADGPPGWTVKAEPTGQSQAVSATVNAGSQAGLTVTVNPADDATAGTYKINVTATVGSQQVPLELSVEVTGNYKLAFAQDQVLSARGASGGATEVTLSITNTGSAPVTAVKMTATKPTDWNVTFDKDTIESIDAGATVDVKAQITPSGDAIAGDYNLTFNAKGAEASTDASFRFTVEASLLGAILGGALIIAAVGGLLWVFRRYGRR